MRANFWERTNNLFVTAGIRQPSSSIFCIPFYPLLSLSGPSLRARSAATEEKKSQPSSSKSDWGGPFLARLLFPAF